MFHYGKCENTLLCSRRYLISVDPDDVHLKLTSFGFHVRLNSTWRILNSSFITKIVDISGKDD